jgi:hypothetical protein
MIIFFGEKVLDELGIEMSAKLESTPSERGELGVAGEKKRIAEPAGGGGSGPSASSSSAPLTVDKNDPDADLFARFAKLNEG